MKVFRGKLESACLSIHVSVYQSICVQNTSVCQRAGGGIKSHLVTALVSPPEHKVLRVIHCDHSPSIVVHLFLHIFCLHSSIYKCKPVSTKLGQNVCGNKSLDQFVETWQGCSLGEALQKCSKN